jgi:hypothetical protein
MVGQIHSVIGRSGGIPAKKTNIPASENRWVISDEKSPENYSQPKEQVKTVNPYEVAARRQAAQEKMQLREHQLLQDARHRVEIITGIGRKTRNVEIISEEDGIKTTFTLRTLKGYEQKLVNQKIEGAKTMIVDKTPKFTLSSLYDIRLETLTHALYLIDGQYIDVILGISELSVEDQMEAKRELVSGMDELLQDKLSYEYSILRKETSDGYLPKTAEEAKEVVDTIHKSSPNS